MAQSAVSVLQPSKQESIAKDLLLILSASLFIGLCAQISIPLPFNPVPITLQTFALLLVGCLLGPKRAAFAVIAYLAQGAIGLPVFAGGTGSIAAFFAPRTGYLIGFLVQASSIGWLVSRGWASSPLRLISAMIFSNALLFICGVSWLSLYVGITQAFLLGCVPFLIGDLLKVVAAAFTYQRLK